VGLGGHRWLWDAAHKTSAVGVSPLGRKNDGTLKAVGVSPYQRVGGSPFGQKLSALVH
jgi:hypothetical protein